MNLEGRSRSGKRRLQKAARYKTVSVLEGRDPGASPAGASPLHRCKVLCVQAAQGVHRLPTTLKESFAYVHEFPVEIWSVFVLKFLESYSYFAVSQILVIYLHSEFGVSDITAGAVYGMWGAVITLTGILTSWVNDSLGVRKATLCGFFLSFISFMVLALTESLDAVYAMIFFLLPLGESMGIPMLTVAIRRCTTQKNRGFAFGLYYSVMNVAALVSGPVVDGFNIGLPDGAQVAGRVLSGNRFIILTCAFATLCSFLVSLLVLKDIKVVDDADVSMGSVYGSPLHPAATAADREDIPVKLDGSPDVQTRPSTTVVASEPVRLSPAETCSSLCRSPTFWRYAALTLLLVNLHAVFRHLDATLPTYLVRLYGDGVPKGIIYSINPFMIIFLTPIVAGVTSKYNHFNMIKYGGYITGISPFFLVFSTSIWAVCLMVVFISLGEAVWSPRVYDYVMSIAPEGKEASFSALASAPLFAAKIPVGLMSGYLLTTYLPEDQDEKRQPKLLWLYIGLLTISSPILITIFDKWIREPEARDKSTDRGASDQSAFSPQPQQIDRNAVGYDADEDRGIDLLDSSDGESLDESWSLLTKASASRQFPDLFKKRRSGKKYSKLSRTSSISSVDAGELCAVTVPGDVEEEEDRHRCHRSDDEEGGGGLFQGSFRMDSMRRRSSDEFSDDNRELAFDHV